MRPVLILPFPVLKLATRIKQVKQQEEPKWRNQSLSKLNYTWDLEYKGESMSVCVRGGGGSGRVRKEEDKAYASVFPVNVFSVLP